MTLKVDPSTQSLGAPRPQTTSATDFRQFAALRRGAEANDPKVLREAAKQFESLFTKMVLDSMRKASFGDPMFGSDQGEMYQGMMDDQLAVSLSEGKGLGLADMLIRQLSGGAATPTDKSEGIALDPAKVDDAQKQKFIDAMLPHATAAAHELGVDPRAIVAQMALETGWGTSQPAEAGVSSHNLFGIKAGGSWQGAEVTSATTEYVAGQAGTENARFRAYGDVAESVADYVRVIRDNPRYTAALNTGGDVRAFATALQKGGYATDPEYANKLIAVAERLGLAAPVTGFKSVSAGPIPKTEPPRMNDA
jgi:peptidoglycan hydrolase FlgJ